MISTYRCQHGEFSSSKVDDMSCARVGGIDQILVYVGSRSIHRKAYTTAPTSIPGYIHNHICHLARHEIAMPYVSRHYYQ